MHTRINNDLHVEKLDLIFQNPSPSKSARKKAKKKAKLKGDREHFTYIQALSHYNIDYDFDALKKFLETNGQAKEDWEELFEEKSSATNQLSEKLRSRAEGVPGTEGSEKYPGIAMDSTMVQVWRNAIANVEKHCEKAFERSGLFCS